MLTKKLQQVEQMLQEVKGTQDKIKDLINERKLMFVDMGINKAVQNITELIVLELMMDSINALIEIDGEGAELNIGGIQSQVPSTQEIFGYISTEYRDSLSDECTTLKKFIDRIQRQEISDKLFN